MLHDYCSLGDFLSADSGRNEYFGPRGTFSFICGHHVEVGWSSLGVV